MDKTIHTEGLVAGYHKALIDANVNADPYLSPQLLTNSGRQKVLKTLSDEMKDCDSMRMSVAFINDSGVTSLKGELKELRDKHIKSQILTTDYLTFSEPKALDTLEGLDNIDLRIYKSGGTNAGFHTKGYMFSKGDDLRVIIGSSNLTSSAICRNQEWNTRLVSTKDGQFAKDVMSEFDSLWERSVPYSQYRDEYSRLYHEAATKRKELAKLSVELSLNYSQELKPNDMQRLFIRNIEKIVNDGGRRALLISATGTGKTFASAFAVRDLFQNEYFTKQRVLFISHREQINKQALGSYKRIFGKHIPMGLLSGSHNDIAEAKKQQFLFSTVNMMSKEKVMQQFAKDDYSVIILDECHRTGADSYQKIIEYFQPDLLLGMSASPDRMDGFDIYKQFDHNIACEIRLQSALENDLLCPFHYFGISDLEIDGTREDDVSLFSKLTSDARVENVIRQAEYYGHCGDKVKGLVFCSSKKEARELSSKFNATGKYKTLALSGDDSQETRQKAVDMLVSDGEDHIDYIFTVDIFNEGVDIPEINQVIMLRQTESPIVFVQQLGRGLRKATDKEYVVVIDFIGNYQNNYMIPMALCGDRSGNKDNIRRAMMLGNNMLTGASTIYFDEVSRKRIYQAIDEANLNQKRKLREDYRLLRYKLGRVPKLVEFDEYGELDPMRLINEWGSYAQFLSDGQIEDLPEKLSETQYNILEFISRKFAKGMRPHELTLLKILANAPEQADLWDKHMQSTYGIHMNKICRDNVMAVLSGKFFRGQQFATSLIDMDGAKPIPSAALKKALCTPLFKDLLNDVLDFGLSRYKKIYTGSYNQMSLCLYQKYTYSEVCWLLNWKNEEVAQNIGGYKFDDYSRTYPIFINYDKAEDIADTINYADSFVDQQTLIAISKSKRKITSKDVQTAIHAKELGITMPLFVRKNKDDKTSKEFYFLGTISFNGNAREFIMPNTDNITAVELGYSLDTPIDRSLFEYITENQL